MTDVTKKTYLLLFVLSLFAFGGAIAEDKPMDNVKQMEEKAEVVAVNDANTEVVADEEDDDDDLDDEELLKLAQTEINDMLNQDDDAKKS